MEERSQYFERMKALADEKRAQFGIETAAFGLREVRKIYAAVGVKIDPWPLPAKIKALYMCDDGQCSVAVQRKLPNEPRQFALVHELKHHFCDQELLLSGTVHCGD